MTTMSTEKALLDNSGKPRSEYIDRLKAMTDEELRAETNRKIWLSAYASNNQRSDYHWQCDATYDECGRRGKPNIYVEEHTKLVEEARR